MAGFAIGALPYFLQYQQQAQQQAQQKQEMDVRMAAFQQQQQDRQRQQAAMAAAGNALPQLLAQPPQPQFPPQQTPAPGQPSQPMIQPGQVPPPPIPPGGVPQGASAGAPGTPPLPPFKSMPTSPPPQQAAQPAAIPAPPSPPATSSAQGQGGPLSIQSAIDVLQKQGLQGADLMAGLQQLQPLLDSQAKAQAAQLQQQFSNELKIQAVQDRHDALEQRREAAQQASEDRRLSIQQRADAARESQALRGEMFQLRVQEAKAKHASDPDAKLDKDTIDVLAQQAMAGDTSVYQNLGRGVQGAQNIVAIRKRVAELAKEQGKTGADIAAGNVAFGGEKAAARSTAVASGKQSQAADEASQLADQALAINDTFRRGNFPDVNAALTDMQRRGGDTQVGQFKVAINGFKNTYSRAISPTGSPTVHDKQHADELFDLNQSPAQFAANIAQAKKEMAAAIAAPGHVQAQQRARIAGKPAEASPAAGGLPAGWTVTEH